jgi:hypothetical protein
MVQAATASDDTKVFTVFNGVVAGWPFGLFQPINGYTCPTDFPYLLDDFQSYGEPFGVRITGSLSYGATVDIGIFERTNSGPATNHRATGWKKAQLSNWNVSAQAIRIDVSCTSDLSKAYYVGR